MSVRVARARAETAELRATVDRFAAVVLDWGLAEPEVEALLSIEGDGWPSLRGLEVAPDEEAETRMRRAIEVAGMLYLAVGDDADCREWLRTRNPGIVGRRRPLDVICDRGVGLRAMRDELREEAMQARVAP